MNIKLNGESVDTEALNLEQLCEALGFGNARIATAVNGEFVPKNTRRDVAIRENDRIEILSPRQGG